MMARKIIASVLAGLLGLAMAACGGAPSGTLPARSLSVELTEFTITPDIYTAQVGEPLSIVVTNAGVLDHDLTILGADGEQYAHVALKSGQMANVDFQPATATEYQLLCSIVGHAKAGMSAQMIVKP